jgi:Tol biopolymer transport system component
VRAFDPEGLQLSGTESSLTGQELATDPGFTYSQFSVSQNGTLVFQSLADSTSRLTWFDNTGKELGEIAELGYRDPRISPDGRRLALTSDDMRNGNLFIRVYDFARRISTRVSDGPADEDPAWSPDGTRVAYGGIGGKTYFLKKVPTDGSSAPSTVVEKAGPVNHVDWSPDGQLLFSDFSKGIPSVTLYAGLNRTAAVLGIGAEGRFSPDGRWVAYGSEGGIVVQSVSGATVRMNVSSGEGAQPVWARDGRSLFYIAPDRKLVAVPFQSGEKTAGVPRVLFQTRIVAPSFFGTQYDVSGDGRFIINSVPANYSSPLTLVSAGPHD